MAVILAISGPAMLLAWLKLAGISYEQVFQDDPRKGPKGKSPWIEIDGERTGEELGSWQALADRAR